jgi:hypothetical protein
MSEPNLENEIIFDFDSLDELRYSNKIMRKFSGAMIRPNRPTYLYDPIESLFYRMRSIFPSIFSYDGVASLLRDLADDDPECYVLAPMYATKIVESRYARTNSESNAEPIRLSASIRNPNRCNAGDVQPLFGGKLQINEGELDGVIREVKEESALTFKKSETIEHSKIKKAGRLSVCYRASIGSTDDAVIEEDDPNTDQRDDYKRKVCMAIYGSAREIADRLTEIPKDNAENIGDDIIALAILPIEVAIQIDEHSVRHWERKAESRRVQKHMQVPQMQMQRQRQRLPYNSNTRHEIGIRTS